MITAIGTGRRPAFGDDDSSSRFDAAVAKGREQQRRSGIRWAVSIGCSVTTTTGHRHGGEELQPGDVGGEGHLRSLVHHGYVQEISEDEIAALNGEGSAYRIVRTVLTRRGPLTPGSAVSVADFGGNADTFKNLLAKGYIEPADDNNPGPSAA